MGLYELLAADPSALRHSDWVELQRLAREWNAALDADQKDAARMREIDALVSGGRLLDRERLMGRADDLMLRHTHWRVDAADLAIETVTAFAAALLTDGAVEAFDNGYDNAFAPELDRFRAGIRAAIKAAGMEPVERTQSCPRCDMHAEEAKQLGETLDQVARYIGRMHEADGHADHRASDAEIVARCRELSVTEETANACHVNHRRASIDRDNETERADKAESDLAAEQVAHAKTRKAHESAMRRADQARAEADALRAEVAALRGLADKPAAVSAVTDAYDYPGPRTLRDRARNALAAAIATVPPAKVGDAVKPESPGLEALPLMSTYGVPELRAITARVNVLSAIVKRGGL